MVVEDQPELVLALPERSRWRSLLGPPCIIASGYPWPMIFTFRSTSLIRLVVMVASLRLVEPPEYSILGGR